MSRHSLDAMSLPADIATDHLLPRYRPNETTSSLVDRAARALRVTSDGLLQLLLDRAWLSEVLVKRIAGSEPDDVQIALDRELIALARTLRFQSTDRLPRLYCARCAYLRFHDGWPYFREHAWAVPWASFCPHDGWPLLEEPAQSMRSVLRNAAWPQEDRSILEARTIWRVSPQTQTHLSWAPVWKVVAELEREWRGGDRLELLQMIGDIASMLCGNFHIHRDFSVLATVCVLPEPRYGFRRTVSIRDASKSTMEGANVHARRAAMCAGYSLLEAALARPGSPPITTDHRAANAIGRKFWWKVSRWTGVAPWYWLRNEVETRWPERYREPVMTYVMTLMAESRSPPA